jgi:hypothetical protein
MAYRTGRLRRISKSPVHPKSSIQRRQTPAIAQAVVQRAINHPQTLTPTDVMALQRTVGNQAVHRLLNDEEPVSGLKRPAAPTGGRPLPPDVQAKMEDSFRSDFSNVRVHEGPQADAINAQAYTQGNHIVFAQRQFDPHTRNGQTVLAHELTHVVQQRAGRVDGAGIDPNPSLEMEAHRTAEKVANGGTAGLAATKSSAQGASVNTIQRLPKWLKKIFRGRGRRNEEDRDDRRRHARVLDPNEPKTVLRFQINDNMDDDRKKEVEELETSRIKNRIEGAYPEGVPAEDYAPPNSWDNRGLPFGQKANEPEDDENDWRKPKREDFYDKEDPEKHYRIAKLRQLHRILNEIGI